MIAIVIVSHSREISDGLKRMAEAMSQENVPIVSAGGMDEPDNPLGTDALLIKDAIEQVIDNDGVLVFADIGAAKLNAEMAIDLLAADQQRKVRFCDAPLVEGVLAAAVQSAGGGTMDAVIQEAQSAYHPPTDIAKETGTLALEHSDNAIHADYQIVNPLGLHARPAARFVTGLNACTSDVRLRNLTKNSGWVNAKSLNKVVTLEVVEGDYISVSADGEDAAQAHAVIGALIDENFGEGPARIAPDAAPPLESAPATAQLGPVLNGIPISPGFAVAPAHHLRTELPSVDVTRVEDTEAEVARLEDALARARDEITGIMKRSRDTANEYDASIFKAHLLHLDDPEIADIARARIRGEQLNAEAAWQQTAAILIEDYACLDDTLLRARGDDLADVSNLVLRILSGATEPITEFDRPVVLCIPHLTPSDVPALDLEHVRGICVETGGKTAHAGILASGLPIPVVFGVGPRLREVEDGAEVILDGTTGTIDIAPDAKALDNMKRKRDSWVGRISEAQAIKLDPAVTRDGQRRRVAANIASVDEAKIAVDSGAEEVGLFRTEFLYMNRDAAPDEEEQSKVYDKVVAQLGGRSLMIRTMDIGGDKPVPYLDRPGEANPNLGWRGLRYGLSNSDLFQTQLRAALRASAKGPVRIMFPMVSTLEEVLAARNELETAKESLSTAGRAFDPDTEIGIMIEVPAAAELAELIAPHIDFFSIGTNDLTQYVMAADRGNPNIADLFDSFHPAVLRAVKRTIVAAKDAGIWVGMCGAMAGDPLATPVLLGLGLDEFSMNSNQIPEFKLDFTKLSADACVDLAHETLVLTGADQVRECIKAFLEETVS